MRDKRMTEFTGRQMVIRLSPTRRVLVGKDATYSDAVHDASVYDMRRDADVETLRPRTSNGDAYSLMTQYVNDTNLYAAVGRRNQYMPRWEWERYKASIAEQQAEPVPPAPVPPAPEPDYESLEQLAGQSRTPSSVMRGFLMECRGRLTQAEYNSVARLVDTLTPAGDWLFIGHYTEMRRRFGGMDSTHEMRVVLATMRGDGWQDYNAVAREETSMSVVIERLANSTPIVHMYGTRERPITLAYAEGYTLRRGTL